MGEHSLTDTVKNSRILRLHVSISGMLAVVFEFIDSLPIPMVLTSTMWRAFLFVAVLTLVLAVPCRSLAQGVTVVEPDVGEGITLTFPENTPLKTLVAYVVERLGLNIVYDESQVNQLITLYTPTPVPETALLDLLESVLRSKGLALEDAGVSGLMRIVTAPEMASTAEIALDDGSPSSGALTRVFHLKHAQTERIMPAIMPLLSRPGGQAAALPDERLLIVTDFASNIRRLGQLIEKIDRPKAEVVLRSVPVRYGEAQNLVNLLVPTLRTADMITGDALPQSPGLFAIADQRTNTLVLAGTAEQMEGALELVRSLDAPDRMERRVYEPLVLSADRLDTLIKQTLGPVTAKRDYRGAADTQNDLLVVTASADVHDQIDLMLEAMLEALPEVDMNPVRFYRLKHTIATDVLSTIRSLEGTEGFSLVEVEQTEEAGSPDTLVPIYGQTTNPVETQVQGRTEVELTSPASEEGVVQPSSAPVDDLESMVQSYTEGGGQPLVAADKNTNSIIVIGSPAQQRVYAAIIEQLDQRRPQVLIETTIVTLDTSDDFTFGVEIGLSQAFGGDGRIISFSSFGIADVDPLTGGLLPTLAPGGTFALLAPDVADVVVRALANNNRSRLVSMPRILVNDNEEGMLDSLSLEPYAVTVVTDTSTTTTAGGPAEAGTTIAVTPHISEDDYLQLQYEVELSSFTSEARPNLPPPSQENKVSSMVTVPDGYTIVVGGLNRQESMEQIQKVPWLGDIPWAGNLFKRTDTDDRNQTLFVFIRPTILRHDDFRDLKYLSDLDRDTAGVPGNYPESEPLLMVPAQ